MRSSSPCKGMCKIMFPAAAAEIEKEHEAQEAAGEAPTGHQKRQRDKVTLHSTQLWPLKGGATGEECFNLVKELTEAKRAKEAETAKNKVARAEAKKSASPRPTTSVHRWLAGCAAGRTSPRSKWTS